MVSKSFGESLVRAWKEIGDEVTVELSQSPVSGRGTVIEDIFYRAEQSAKPDGYGRGTSFEPGARSVPDSRPPTGALVGLVDDELSKDDWDARARQVERDVINEAVRDIAKSQALISREIRRIRKKRQVVMNTASAERGRQSSLQDPCVCCGDTPPGTPDDHLQMGLDNKCRIAYSRYSDTHPLAEFGSDPKVRLRHFITARRLKRQVAEASLPEGADLEWRIREITKMQTQGNLPAEREH